MANMSDYLESALRDHIFRTTVYTRPTTLYVGLFTVTPSDAAGSGTEVSGGSYARVPRGPANADWTAANPTDGLTDNAAAITFPAPTANWTPTTQIVAFGIFDAVSGGNLLIWGPISPGKSVNSGDPAPSFATGALDIVFA